jgi:hypothetical protein
LFKTYDLPASRINGLHATTITITITMDNFALLSELTLKEKVSLLSGDTFRSTPAVPRLGINPLCVSFFLLRSYAPPQTGMTHKKKLFATCRPAMASTASGPRPTIAK